MCNLSVKISCKENTMRNLISSLSDKHFIGYPSNNSY
jgi:hypothetical protein